MLSEKTKLTLRLETRLIEAAKAYAEAHDTSLSQLVARYFEFLSEHDEVETMPPILARLSGIVSEVEPITAYQDYLLKKYDG